MSENIRTTLTLPKELWEKLKKLSDDERRSINAQTIKIIEEYFNTKSD